MKTPIFTGAAVAIITPMLPDGSVDYKGLADLIEFQIKGGTDAVVICGTTGESATLKDDEHLECIRVAVETAAGRIPVIAGTGSNYTEHAVEMSKEAKARGADALLLVTPYYNKTTQRGLVASFNTIVDAAGLPAILYNVPSRTGVNIESATAKELAKNPLICGIKEASGNISQIAMTAALCGDELPSIPATTIRWCPFWPWAARASFRWSPTWRRNRCTACASFGSRARRRKAWTCSCS